MFKNKFERIKYEIEKLEDVVLTLENISFENHTIIRQAVQEIKKKIAELEETPYHELRKEDN